MTGFKHTKWYRKHRCIWCRKWVMFPFLHFIVHMLDTLKEAAKKENEKNV